MDDGYVDHLGQFYLDIPLSKIAEFQMNYQDPARMKEAYLDYYAHNHPLASWTEVAKALNVCGLHHQANVVENTYVQGMQSVS